MAIQASGLTDGVFAPLEKIGMINSISCRLPFADHRLAEFLIGLPDDLRIDGHDKVILRDYMAKHHPDVLPPPAAPGAPRKSLLAECLAAEPLKGMVETCLSESSIRRRELFDWKKVKTILAGAQTEETIYAKQVFALLSLEIWFRIFVDHEKGWMSH
jgi:asparagine synthase (glutamine-hydrolysing)